MTTHHHKTLEDVLLARALELARAVTAERNQIAVEQSADEMEAKLLAAERETSARTLMQDSRLLKEVQAARDRMRQGTFGICLRCEEEIASKRLQAIPWAALCVSCQAKAERESASWPPLAQAA